MGGLDYGKTYKVGDDRNREEGVFFIKNTTKKWIVRVVRIGKCVTTLKGFNTKEEADNFYNQYKMEEQDFLTEEYGKTISFFGIVCSKLTGMDDFVAISDEINFKNYPKDYQCFLNKETLERVNLFLDEFKNLFNERVSVKVETGINSFYYYGVHFVLKENYFNNQNIMIPLDLKLVTEENSILITE